MSMKGVTEVRARLRKIMEEHPERVKRALYTEANIEVTEMKKRTPVDTTPNAPHPGNLRNSIHAEEPTQDRNRFSVIIATGMQAPYAIYVHENPDAFHPVGEWKFMESVLNESRPHMAARIARHLKLG